MKRHTRGIDAHGVWTSKDRRTADVLLPIPLSKSPPMQLQGPTVPMTLYLTADHDVGHFGLAIVVLPFVIPGAHREDEVSWVALALSDEEAAMLPLLRQQLLCFFSRQVTVEPPVFMFEREQAELSCRVRMFSGTTHTQLSSTQAPDSFLQGAVSDRQNLHLRQEK